MDRQKSLQIRADELRRHISYLARTASIELTPKEILQAAPYRKLLAAGTQVYVPHVPRERPVEIISAVRALLADGMVPVPHIAARRLKAEVELDELLDQLQEAGCTQALIIGGGSAIPEGPFESALQVLHSGKLERAGFRRIGIAGHPEGSPDISNEALRQAYFEKVQLAGSGVFDMYIVTQFSFDAPAVLSWEKMLRKDDNALSIHVGLAGVTSATKLLKFAAICGVKASAGFLKQGVPALGRLLTRWSPNAMILEIASHMQQDPKSSIRQLHFFPFGGFPDTVDWLKALGDGRYELIEEKNEIRLVVEADAS